MQDETDKSLNGLKHTKGIRQFTLEEEQIKGKGFYHKGVEYIHHSDLAHHETAYFRLSRRQAILMMTFVVVLAIGLIFSWKATLITLIAFLTIIYFADLLFNLFLIIRSFSNPSEIQISDEELKRLNDDRLPRYTIMCPLYHEANVLP